MNENIAKVQSRRPSIFQLILAMEFPQFLMTKNRNRHPLFATEKANISKIHKSVHNFGQ